MGKKEVGKRKGKEMRGGRKGSKRDKAGTSAMT